MPSNNGYQPLASYGPHPSQVANGSQSLRPRHMDEVCADGTPLPPLRIADKVVWLSDNGPEFGIVKWLGKLPDVGHEWMAGVDFVNPVGSGTGLYNEHKLFETRMNHASLVPIVGLMKATDYLGTAPGEDAFPPQKPRRTKQRSGENSNSRFYVGQEPASPKMSFGEDVNNVVVGSPKANRQFEKLTSDLNNIQVNPLSTIDSAQSNEKMMPGNNKVKIHFVEQQSNPIVSNSPPSSNGILPKSFISHLNVSEPNRDLKGSSNETFEIGTVVEVTINSSPYYGVIRWLGFSKNNLDYDIDSIQKSDKNFKNVIAGLELEEEISGLTDGTLNGRRYFHCPINKAYFTSLNECSKDSRFCSSLTSLNEATASASNRRNSSLFGSIDCPTVLGDVAPLTTQDDLSRLCGKNRGIQGHHNSCYLDATLFAMFSSTTVFESLLYRPKRPDDIPEYNEVQRILKEEIVNPLRANLYVRADRVMHLRQLLERISSVRGLTSEEKDPEEFLNLLLSEILKTDPYLKLSSGLESFFYQLFVEKDENLQMPTVQQLFDQSFLASDIKLREIPPCLLIQMPRFGREYKMYNRIIPSLYLDITNVLENSPRQCIVCGELAEFECKECFGKFGEGLESIAFCTVCLDKSHSHKKRSKHKTAKLGIPAEFAMLRNHTNIPRVVMELFAVLCIETSHYVSFVKCGQNSDSPWCFFDSMADRKGEQNGYNIPEVASFSDLRWWLSPDGTNFLLNNKDDKLIPELPRRLLSDAYICFYSSEVLRYR